mmetsp:Transcript_48802/g.130638  ORF Transcript_48802/g.130638 Transcript_48802/m.130638 type:complete len:235 (-) Transcript_48802:124-828(-)
MVRSSKLLSAVCTVAIIVVSLRIASFAFVPAARPQPSVGAPMGVAVATAAALGAAPPAFAEEEAGGLLNFGKIPLGGGFAINLDIPETGIINIVVLIGGLLYLLAPLLSESMASREKEIQTDIDDAIAKYDEATGRLTEAQKAKAQADEVIGEINASIDKDKKEFEATLQAQTKATLQKQAAAAEATLKDLEARSAKKVEAFIQEEAINRGLKELTSLKPAQKAAFLDAAIQSL